MNQPKHIFIINPKAGKGAAESLAKDLRQLFLSLSPSAMLGACEIVTTKARGHATTIARDFAARGRCRFYAVGGDGTLNEVLNGMAGTSSSLACIPCGSGNDFLHSILGDYRPEDLLKETILAEEVLIDAGSVSGRYFLNVASIGFDARATHRSEYFKGKPLISPKLAYYGGILASLHDLGATRVTIKEGARERQAAVFMMTVCNGRIYGGGYHIAPDALLDDGLFDVLEVAPLSILKIAQYLPKLKKGTHLGLPEIRFYRTDKLGLSSETEFALNVDGEPSFAREADFTIRAASIPMVIPHKAGLPETFAVRSGRK